MLGLSKESIKVIGIMSLVVIGTAVVTNWSTITAKLSSKEGK